MHRDGKAGPAAGGTKRRATFRIGALGPLVVLVLAACSGPDGGRTDTGGPDGAADLPFDRAEIRLDLVVNPDAPRDEAPADPGEDRATLPDPGDPGPDGLEPPPDGGPDGAGDVAQCQGDAGCPCLRDADCFSNVCIVSLEGRVCAGPCGSGCPAGWACRSVGAPDPIDLCVPLQPTLCRPCRTDGDCAVIGMPDLALKCLDHGPEAGRFCGGPCASAADCPEGFRCDGAPDGQCRPDGGECPCPPWAVEVGAATDCARTGPVGTCRGTRTCAADGLTSCDARTPLPEVCNGQDDDCDGLTDAADATVLAAHDAPPCEASAGVCLGAAKPPSLCVGGEWKACTAAVYLAHDPSWEYGETKCDGKDNDCDGVTDNDFPDTDGDHQANCVDPDDDEDGIPDDGDGSGVPGDSSCAPGQSAGCDDNCAMAANPDQADRDLDGKGDACDPDVDGDGVSNTLDNCPTDPNPGQADLDGDHVGDACDEDADGDGDPRATDCDDLDGARHHGAAEGCNGRDDDCDGKVDAADAADLLAGDPRACGKQDGVCAGSIRPARLCAGGTWLPCDDDAYRAHATAYQAGVETACDGQDNDCDGTADENFPWTAPNGVVILGVGAACGLGRCAGGVTTCRGDGAGITCSTAGLAGDETCNREDDDCDGLTDADDGTDLLVHDGQACERQEGVCKGAARPATLCVDGFWRACDASVYAAHSASWEAAPETRCDGLDNDCSGAADNGFADTDADGQANCVDPDDDQDGVPDDGDASGVAGDHPCAGDSTTGCDDNCPLAANPDQKDSDGDGRGDACEDDRDGDGIPNATDDCPSAFNPDQIDTDADGLGDACDPDMDDDGVPNAADCAPRNKAVFPGAREVCNGLDDDCDGSTDAADGDLLGNDAQACERQVGACVLSTKPARLCSGGQWLPCDDEAYAAHGGDYQGGSERSCDGLDNDCDGATDEDFVLVGPDGATSRGVGAACGTGRCDGGTTVCTTGGAGITCSTAGLARHETCNGEDDDCDGRTDADDAADLLAHDGQPCERQAGVCQGAPKPAALCTQGAWQACGAAQYLAHAPAYEEGAEVLCDGLDNDCDGSFDEDFQVTTLDGKTRTGVGVACGSGICAGATTTCRTDRRGVECPKELMAAPETCNKLDDDCNGKVDDLPSPCPVDVTFNVDMICTPNVAIPQVAGGTLFGTPGDHPMTDPDMDNIWTTTLKVARNLTTKFVFANGPCADWSCREPLAAKACAVAPYDDRQFTTGTADLTLTECFGRCGGQPCNQCPLDAPASEPEPTCPAPKVKVTFAVDLARNRDVSWYNTIALNGDFNNWTPGIVLHRHPVLRTVYLASVCLDPGRFYGYKFTGYNYANGVNEFPNNAYTPAQDPCPGHTRTQACAYGNCTDRTLTTGTTDQVLPVRFWASCDSYALP